MIGPVRKLRALFVEDSEEDAFILVRHLGSCGYSVEATRVETAESLAKALSENIWDVILCDHNLPGFDALQALEVLAASEKDIPLIVISGSIGETRAVEIMRAGAHDYIQKDSLARLEPALEREIAEAENRRRKREAEFKLQESNSQLTKALESVERVTSELVRVERMKAMGQLASGIAHDFNNTLTKMLGQVESLMDEGLPEKHPLMRVKTLIMDAAEVVDRLRDFYRPLSSDGSCGAVQVNEIVRDCIELTKPKWKIESERSGIPVRVVAECSEVPPVSGQASELREALTNLIFNACDAMAEGGMVHITTSLENNRVVVSVRDTGHGMDEETLMQCREPFFSTKGKLGSGLGLGLVDNMMRKFGGSLEIDSQKGVGTTMILRFAIAHVDTSESDLVVDTHQEIGKLNVLLAEDDPAVAQILSHYLELDGHSAMVAFDGLAALEHYLKRKFDVVISDRAMPLMGGDELISKIRSISPNQPVIMATGLVDPAGAGGVNSEQLEFLPKPFSRDSLRQALFNVTLGREVAAGCSLEPSGLAG